MNLFLVTFFLLYGGTYGYFFLKMKAAVPFGWGAGGRPALRQQGNRHLGTSNPVFCPSGGYGLRTEAW